MAIVYEFSLSMIESLGGGWLNLESSFLSVSYKLGVAFTILLSF